MPKPKGKYDATDHAIRVIKLEIDYHLLALHEAMKDGDISEQEVQKRKLEGFHGSLKQLGYFSTANGKRAGKERQ